MSNASQYKVNQIVIIKNAGCAKIVGVTDDRGYMVRFLRNSNSGLCGKTGDGWKDYDIIRAIN